MASTLLCTVLMTSAWFRCSVLALTIWAAGTAAHAGVLNPTPEESAAEVDRYIGQPFDVPDLGQIKYPFVVLVHSSGQNNVLLVGP